MMMRQKTGRKKELSWSLVLVFLSAQAAWSADIYVSVPGGGDGSIASPMDLQAALDLARTNGSEDTLYLMAGEYDASTTGADTYEYGSVSNDGMKTTLSGSWNSTYTEQKTFEAPVTKLDGKGTSRVLSVHADAVSFDFAMEYIQLENGMITSGGGNGAGLLAYTENSGELNLTLHHISFEDNRTVIDSSNRSYGGGMYSNCFFELTEGRFKDNQAYGGGAMFIADKPGGDKSMAPIIDNTLFEGNICGNASYPGLVGSTIYYSCSPRITRSLFTAPDYTAIGFYPNSALDSGYGAGTLALENSVFSGFKSYHWGGAISLWDTSANISNCLFINNRAGYSGSGAGGAITVYDSSVLTAQNTTVTNCTFVGNRSSSAAVSGGAIHNRVQGITVINSIFWDNGSNGLYKESGTGTVSYSDIEGGVASSLMTDGGNTINTTPLFVDTAGEADNWDLRLQNGSPAIDTGDNNAPYLTTPDLDGNFRIWDGNHDSTATVDMGCYELIVKNFSWPTVLPAIIGKEK
ncbi:MAG: right-handed parallel beta-helix repeat-containing protein [Proteobacteria bacterium]|nr:right-handed parallel beta-helix repeat-containing protein [Pseudomonadota bacterium]MBU1059105.1 right-handed parallel beta-helix repeat-containing protein [Pseudomonadota bacterium]